MSHYLVLKVYNTKLKNIDGFKSLATLSEAGHLLGHLLERSLISNVNLILKGPHTGSYRCVKEYEMPKSNVRQINTT